VCEVRGFQQARWRQTARDAVQGHRQTGEGLSGVREGLEETRREVHL